MPQKSPSQTAPDKKRFGEGSTNLLKIWDQTQDPEHPLAGMAVVAGGDSLPRPLVLPPQGTSPREEPRKGSPHAASRAGRVQWDRVCRIAPSPLPAPSFVFFFFCSLQLVKTRTSKIDELSNYVR